MHLSILWIAISLASAADRGLAATDQPDSATTLAQYRTEFEETDEVQAPLPDPSNSPAPVALAGKPAVLRTAAAEEEIEEVIISSTRTPQKVEEAPSIVTVITRDDIRKYGFLTLDEVFRYVIGFDLNDNGHWPDIGVRGINDQTTYGDKIKMMVDGHNMSWRQFNRNYFNPTWVDMGEIDRIELMRGPGGAMWGANALTGVVNIVTRPLTPESAAEVDFGTNHLGESNFLAGRINQSAGPVIVHASFSHYFDKADPLLAPLREFELLHDDRETVKGSQQEGTNLTLKAKMGPLQLSFQQLSQTAGAPLCTFSVIGGQDSRFITDRYITRLAYTSMLTPTLELSSSLDIDSYAFANGTVYEDNARAATAGDPVTGKDSTGAAGRYLRTMAASDRRYELKVQTSYLPTTRLIILGGVELEYLDLVRWYFPQVWQASSLKPPTFTNYQLSAMTQVQYTIFESLSITTGVRYDYDEVYQSVVTPRAGVVLQLPFGLYLKGLYGYAYKAPSFHDLYYYRKNAFYGNPELKPEKSNTGEIQLGYKLMPLLHARLTLFYTRIDDLIGYKTQVATEPMLSQGDFPASERPDGTKEYQQKVNQSNVTTKGLESEIWFRLPRESRLMLAGTFRLPQDDKGKRLAYTSAWSASSSLFFKLSEHLSAALRLRAEGTKEVPAKDLNKPGFLSWAADADPTREAPDYILGTLVLNATLTDKLSLHLKFNNFTDTQWYDAGQSVLFPQRGFEGTIWVNLAL